MIVKCEIFELKEKKIMQDGNFIPANQKLLYICTEDLMMQFETIEDSGTKKVFWAEEKEVVFVESKEEEWDEERLNLRQKEINGNWLII